MKYEGKNKQTLEIKQGSYEETQGDKKRQVGSSLF